MKNATPTNAPDTTVPIADINVSTNIQQGAKGAQFSPRIQLVDGAGKPFGSPYAQSMLPAEVEAYQAEVEAAISATSKGPTMLAYLKRAYNFTLVPGT